MSAIVVLGSANMDLVVRQPRLPHPGETMFGSSFATIPGGKGLNQAVAAARAGGDVGFLGAIGRDGFGEALRRCLEQDGIDTSGVREVDDPTGTAHISVLDGGENAIVVVSGANAAITALDDGSRREIEKARYLVAQFERPIELIGEAFVVARGLGITTVLTPAPVQKVDEALLQLTDILIPNAQEACELAGISDETEAAARLSGITDGLIVMTRGSRGALVARGGKVELEVPPRTVEPVDTTAAGDTFAGTLVAFLAEGAPLEDALRAATVAASISVTRPGASTSMPTRAEIDEVLAG
ncbi:MAG: ribokinase [Microbacteriaceae bacterium]